jgi:undecaprenyl diphosphate synthase
VSTITKETKTLMDNEVRLNAIGDLDSLPKNCHQELKEAMAKTSQNKRCTLTLALSYSSRWELTQAAKHIAELVKAGKLDPQDIDENLISKQLNTADLPDPELMIRTSGELRISNFLLWQLAYAELYFTPKLWPDFRREDLFEAILDYQKRERRFGMTSEQLK